MSFDYYFFAVIFSGILVFGAIGFVLFCEYYYREYQTPVVSKPSLPKDYTVEVSMGKFMAGLVAACVFFAALLQTPTFTLTGIVVSALVSAGYFLLKQIRKEPVYKIPVLSSTSSAGSSFAISSK